MKKLNLFTLIYLMQVAAKASEHAAAHEGFHLPHGFHWVVFNFAVFALLIYFFARKPVKEYFRNQKEDFLNRQREAAAAIEAAQAKKMDIQNRLTHLVQSADQSIETAKKEAALLKERILADAREVEERLQRETKVAETNERNKAQARLKDMLLSESVNSARETLKKELKEADLKRLQTEFVEKIQVVTR